MQKSWGISTCWSPALPPPPPIQNVPADRRTNVIPRLLVHRGTNGCTPAATQGTQPLLHRRRVPRPAPADARRAASAPVRRAGRPGRPASRPGSARDRIVGTRRDVLQQPFQTHGDNLPCSGCGTHGGVGLSLSRYASRSFNSSGRLDQPGRHRRLVRSGFVPQSPSSGRSSAWRPAGAFPGASAVSLTTRPVSTRPSVSVSVVARKASATCLLGSRIDSTT